ncbi:hypothetical protein J7E25_16185 [Agromyces sp. ISL-38]|uniref:hypothetical protein n=1 Tax=Agromyces sp. ISL-38 TaxID=2819107 RepID=UPI001BE69AD4|nr:hypothetical protein [Agromyces sp. ISL-38]MBT2500637.1 hypothetical protein [Agromyces sp. ISL-38]
MTASDVPFHRVTARLAASARRASRRSRSPVVSLVAVSGSLHSPSKTTVLGEPEAAPPLP